MNPLIQGHSGTTPEVSWNAFSINQGTNEDDSQSDPHPEAGLFNNQMTQNSGPEDGHYNITQVSEEIEDRVTRKLSQEFSRTESRILGALSKLDKFLLNPLIRTHSETVRGTFRNTNVENQGTNEDDSQSDPHPEAGIFRSQTTQNSAPEETKKIFFAMQEAKCWNNLPHPVTVRIYSNGNWTLCGSA